MPADEPTQRTPVRDLTKFCIDVLGTVIEVSLTRNPFKSDEEHMRSKFQDFSAALMSVPGITSASRFAVANHPDWSNRDLEGVWEEMYLCPYMTNLDWTGPIVQGKAAFALTRVLSPTGSGESSHATISSKTSAASRQKGSTEIPPVQTVRALIPP